jgi:PleD family two-component response regulator
MPATENFLEGNSAKFQKKNETKRTVICETPTDEQNWGRKERAVPNSKRNDSKESRILVVEDNADDRELLLRQLRKAGLANHMKFIADGKEALDSLTGPQEEEIPFKKFSELLVLRPF